MKTNIKKLVNTLVIALVFNSTTTFGQTVANVNQFAIAYNSSDSFNFLGNTVSHYGLGWYNEAPTPAPFAYFSGYAGLRFFTEAQSRMFLDKNGNLGLGTTNSLSRLHIAGGDESITLGDYTGTNNTKGIYFAGFRDIIPNYFGASIEAVPEWICCGGYPATGYPGIRNMGINFNVHGNVDVADSKITALSINSIGNIGVGTLTPGEKLEVNGNAYFQRLRSGNALFKDNSRNSLNSFNTGQDPSLSTGWIAADFGGSDNASDRLVVGSGFGGRVVIGTHNYNLTSWGGDLLISPTGGNVAIGTTAARERLSVNGKIRAHEIKVESANWPDYVFKKEYALTPLSEVEKYINTNGHLPEIPSALEVQKEGIALGELNNTLVKKIEELTLHLIEQQKQLTEQGKLIKELQEKSTAKK